MREKLLRSIYRLVRRRSWWVLGISLLLTLLSLAYISQLRMRSSFLILLPQDDPLRLSYERREELLQKTDALAVLLSLKEPADSIEAGVEKLKNAADALIAKLKESSEIEAAGYRSDIEIPQLNPFLASMEQLLELTKLGEAIRQSLSTFELPGKERLAESYKNINERLEQSIRVSASTEVDIEALTQQLRQLGALNEEVKNVLSQLPEQVGEAEEQLNKLLGSVNTLEERLKATEYLSRDKRALLVLVRPQKSAQYSLAYNSQITQLVQEAIEQVGLRKTGVEAELTGPYVFSTESNQLIQQDMWKMTIISSIGILLIFTLAFGSFLYPLMAAIPMFVALFMTLAWAKLTVGGLNLVTSFVPSLVLGLGIDDYGIHFLTHYTEERRRGLRIGPALESTILHTGSAILTAALTTSFVIFGLTLALSPGLVELGLIAGMGILLSALAALFILPALIIAAQLVFKKRFRQAPRRYQPDFTRIVQRILAYKKPILIASALATLLILWPALKVEFQFASEEMVPKHLKSQAALKKIREQFELGATDIGEFFVFFAKSDEALERISAELKKIELIDNISSIYSFVPPEKEAKEKEQIIKQLNLEKELEQGRGVLNNLEANLAEKDRFLAEVRKLIGNLSYMQTLASAAGRGDLSVELGRLIQSLLELEARFESLNAEQLSGEVEGLKESMGVLEHKLKPLLTAPKPQMGDLPRSILDRFLTQENEFVAYAHVKGAQLYRQEYYKSVIERIRQIAKENGADYFGTPLIQSRLEEYMLRDFWVSTLIAVFVIFILLWMDFRQTLSIPALRFSPLLAMLPLILGYAWMLGSMKLFNIHFNFTNILISPLLVGIGVGYSIYILHRYAEEGDVAKAVSATMPAILTSALTTMTAFGSLLAADTPGLKILGQSALLGIGFTTLFSLIFLPAAIGGLTEAGQRDKIKE